MLRLWAGLVLATSLMAQSTPRLGDLYQNQVGRWETQLDKGQSSLVKKQASDLLLTKGAGSSSDPNDMVAQIGLRKVLSRASVLDGTWEEALRHLQEAQELARENIQSVEETYTRLRKENEEKISSAKLSIDKFSSYLIELQELRNTTVEQQKRKKELEVFLAEQRQAITRSQNNIATMNQTLTGLKKENEDLTDRILNWRIVLEQEKKDLLEQGPAGYATKRLKAIKSDQAQPLFDRRSHAARLCRLQPKNKEALRLWGQLLNTSIKN